MKPKRGNDSKSMKPEKKFYPSTDKKGPAKGMPRTSDGHKAKAK